MSRLRSLAASGITIALVVLACLFSVGMTEPENLHPDWTGRDPVVWRLPLDSGGGTALYFVKGKLLVQYRDLRTLIVGTDGQVEQEFTGRYNLFDWLSNGIQGLLVDDESIYTWRPAIQPALDASPVTPVPCELLQMDLYGVVLNRWEVPSHLGLLSLLKVTGDLVLAVDAAQVAADDPGQEAVPGGPGWLKAYREGELLWQKDLADVRNVEYALLAGGVMLYVDSGQLIAVDPTGQELWSVEVGDQTAPSMFPLDENLALLVPERPRREVQAYGTDGWRWTCGDLSEVFDVIGVLGGEPEAGSLPSIVLTSLSSMTSIGINGEKQWSRQVNSSYRLTASPGGKEYYCKDHSLGLAAYDLRGNLLWSEPRISEIAGEFIADEMGRLYLINGNELYCIDTTAYTPRQPVVHDAALAYFAEADQARIRWKVPADIFLSTVRSYWVDPPKVDTEGYIYFQDSPRGSLQILKPDGEIYTEVYECGAAYGEFTVRPEGGLYLVVDEYNWDSPDYPLVMSDLGCADREGHPLFKNDVMQYGELSQLEVHGDRLYSLGASVTCFNFDGSARWTLPLDPDASADEMAETPDGNLVVRVEREGATHLLYFDEQGAEQSRCPIPAHSVGPAVAADGTLVLHQANQSVYAVDRSGNELWRHDYTPRESATRNDACGSPVAVGNTIYAGTMGGELLAFTSSGELLWRYSAGAPVSTPVVAADGTVYASALHHSVFAVSPAGTERWNLAGLGFIISPPVLGMDGSVLVLIDNALLALQP